MTTIAWHRAHGFAADTQINGDFKCFTHKLHRLKGGALAGFCGDIAPALRFLEWYGEGCDRDREPTCDTEDGFECIIVLPSGVATWWNPGLYGLPILEPFYAIGSGSQAAMVAMHLGKTPAQAVRVAMLYDSDTGMGVETLPPHRGKRKAKR